MQYNIYITSKTYINHLQNSARKMKINNETLKRIKFVNYLSSKNKSSLSVYKIVTVIFYL